MNQLHILHLYPNEMNTYGDRGNILCLINRARLLGYEPVIHYHHPGDNLIETADIVFGGGGQDSMQDSIQEDVLRIGDALHKLAEAKVPMLMICGMYQLFGHTFTTQDNTVIKGIGILDVETHGSSQRLIGNAAIETVEFGVLYGFENHSGQTTVNDSKQVFGTSIRGFGNNQRDKTGGARLNNVIGCYLHGPMLSLNSSVADWLIQTAAANRDYTIGTPKVADNSLVTLARQYAAKRTY